MKKLLWKKLQDKEFTIKERVAMECSFGMLKKFHKQNC